MENNTNERTVFVITTAEGHTAWPKMISKCHLPYQNWDTSVGANNDGQRFRVRFPAEDFLSLYNVQTASGAQPAYRGPFCGGGE
jgi:hypothetical protein